jgi:hypothetical protein
VLVWVDVAEFGVDAGVEFGVGVTEIHPVVPKLVNVYNGPPGNVLVEPITITVLFDTLNALHLSFTEKDPNGYAIEYPTLLALQSRFDTKRSSWSDGVVQGSPVLINVLTTLSW